MARTPNIYGGGSKTNANGLHFEQTTSLNDALENIGYRIINKKVYNAQNQIIGISAPKHDLYREILIPRNIDYTTVLSKKILPDEAFYNAKNNTIYIIEKKFQSSAGSVDEKIQTCDFKKKQYQKLFLPIGIQVEYIYVLNDWFKRSEYRDVLNYINSVGCHYYYNEIPLEFLNL